MHSYLIGGFSDKGHQRPNNEDSFLIPSDSVAAAALYEERGMLLAVADGVGGRQAGEIASQTAVRHVHDAYYRLPFRGVAPTLVEAVSEANQAVWATAQQTGQAGMATTLVAVVVYRDLASVAYVGDSRVYLITPDAIHPLTRDHTVVNELLRTGALTEAEAANHPQRHILSRSLGSAEMVEAGSNETQLRPNDALLLCSDGLSNQVAERVMAEVVRAMPPQAAAERLVALANAAGGADNITVVVVRQAGAASGPWSALAAAPGRSDKGLQRLLMPAVLLVSLFALAALGLFVQALDRPPAAAAPTQAAVATATAAPSVPGAAPPPPSPTVAPAPTSTVAQAANAPAAGREAELRDPWGRSVSTFLYRDRNDRTGIVDVPLNGSARVVVYDLERGNPTGYRPSGSDTESHLWYWAEYNGRRGWVVCPIVYFTDEPQGWAKCP